MKNLRDKVAAITGAASGIGAALARQLAARGCHLALADLDEPGLQRLAAELAPSGVRITTARLDVADRAAVHAWAQACAQQHGAVHLVFNNAGVSLSARMADVSPEDFHWLMGINFWGVVHGTQAFLPLLQAAGQGHIVNISSLFGLMSVPSQGAYNASKFAVRGFTEALRMELDMAGGAVSATCVHPGGIATGIARAGRVDPRLAEFEGDTPELLRRQGDRLIQRTTPAQAAAKILRAVEKNQRRVLIGGDAWLLDKLVRLLGAAYQPVLVSQMAAARRQRQRWAAAAAALLARPAAGASDER